MTIYVDDANIPAKVGRHTSRWFHLISDTSDEELHTFAAQLGLRRSYFQKPNAPLQTHRHYDVTEGVRAKAVALGAVEITRRVYAGMIGAERERLRQAKEAADSPAEAEDACRVVDVPDVGPVRVLGQPFNADDATYFAEIVQAARRKYVAENGEPDA